MAQFDLSVRAVWFCPDPSFASSNVETDEQITVSADSEADISDADIRAALAPLAPPDCELSGYTVEGVFAPEIGGTITVYATATFDCGTAGLIYRTFRVDVPTTSTRDEVLDEMLLNILAQMDVSSDRYECTYVGFEITAPLLYQYAQGG